MPERILSTWDPRVWSGSGGFPVPADVVIDVDTVVMDVDIDGELNDVDVVTIGNLMDGCCLVIKSFMLHVALPTVLLIQCNDL